MNRSQTIIIEYNNKRMTIEEWSLHTGISAKAIYFRLYRGWDIERALTQKPRERIANSEGEDSSL